MAPHSLQRHTTSIDRYYVDTRPLVASSSPQDSQPGLPLLSTLQFSDQEAVTRFIRPADRFMSLASALLKYTFIHRRGKIPWSDVQISRTPRPHSRPYWEPPRNWNLTEDGPNGAPVTVEGLEFNVSHQAGLVAIIGCSTPTAPLANPSNSISHSTPLSATLPDSLDRLDLTGHHTSTLAPGQVRLGVDIACTNEDKRTPKDMATQDKFDEWVEIFAEMFSDRERRLMRTEPIHVPVVEREEGDWGSDADDSSLDGKATISNEATKIQLKLRRFYAYWGLKEAYIKMVGEGLLADWLRELEFLNVLAPPPPPTVQHAYRTRRPISPAPLTNVNINAMPNAQAHNNTHLHPEALHSEVEKWTPPEKAETRVTTLFRGRPVEDVNIELVAYEEDFIVATATRGVQEVEGQGMAGAGARRWLRLDIERDIQPCADGTCQCLE